MKITRWEGCYDSSWKGLITDKSFAHPAKFARGLIERIYDHCLAKGYLKRGDVVGDCFGGIGTGGVTAAYRGLNWIGCELEPRFVEMAQENFRLHRHGWHAVRGGEARIVQGNSRKFDEAVAGIVSSPPYAEIQTTVGNVGNAVYKEYGKASSLGKHDKYGREDGQIGSLKSGAVEAVISSPPFTQGYQSGGGINKNGYGKDGADKVGERTYQGQGGDRTSGNIETLKEGNVQAVIASPPYSETETCGNRREFTKYDSGEKRDREYGQSPGQISQLKGGSVDGVVSSPPFEDCFAGGEKVAGKFSKRPDGSAFGAGKSMETTYGSTEGQIGKENGETYWEAVKAVYEACFRAIKPGGVICLVVKDYCKAGKRVRLCDDTLRLLEHIGFTPLERIHAMLVSETVENGLFGDEKTTKQRKSFFRRLYEAKIPEGDERRIDHEEVLICRRP